MGYHGQCLLECGTPTDKRYLAISETRYVGSTRYQNVAIYQSRSFGKLWTINGVVQSAATDEYRYNEALVHPALTMHECPRSVLIIGGGDGAAAREVLKHPTIEKVVMVDIDGELVGLAKQHLAEWHQGAFENPKLTLVIDDGVDFVKTCRWKYDVVIIDVADSFKAGDPGLKFLDEEFLRELKNRALADKGILCMQSLKACNEVQESFVNVFHHLKPTFRHALPYTVYLGSFRSEWGFVIASDGCNFSGQSAEKVNKILQQRKIEKKLKFYDGDAHQALFSISKDIRQLFSVEERVEKEIPSYCKLVRVG